MGVYNSGHHEQSQLSLEGPFGNRRRQRFQNIDRRFCSQKIVTAGDALTARLCGFFCHLRTTYVGTEFAAVEYSGLTTSEAE